ncbi:MAG: hypothetical protein QOJ57_1816, partial [Thermoleophilaceae bacterium]|nr:hypothetical protein [Thermoleophilaceae bacterium]
VRRNVARLDAITFLGPKDRRRARPAIEWDPDPLVRVRRGVERLRAIKF